MANSPPRYDWATVDRYIERHWSHVEIRSNDPLNVSLATFLGIHEQAIHRSRRQGTMPTVMADRVAVCLGLHPCLLWPSWFDDAALEPHCSECGEPASIAHGVTAKVCSDKCREHNRRARKKLEQAA